MFGNSLLSAHIEEWRTKKLLSKHSVRISRWESSKAFSGKYHQPDRKKAKDSNAGESLRKPSSQITWQSCVDWKWWIQCRINFGSFNIFSILLRNDPEILQFAWVSQLKSLSGNAFVFRLFLQVWDFWIYIYVLLLFAPTFALLTSLSFH